MFGLFFIKGDKLYSCLVPSHNSFFILAPAFAQALNKIQNYSHYFCYYQSVALCLLSTDFVKTNTRYSVTITCRVDHQISVALYTNSEIVKQCVI